MAALTVIVAMLVSWSKCTRCALRFDVMTPVG